MSGFRCGEEPACSSPRAALITLHTPIRAQAINLGALEFGQQKQMIDEYNAKEEAAEACGTTFGTMCHPPRHIYIGAWSPPPCTAAQVPEADAAHPP